MLTSLTIRNVVLIDKLDLNFKSGLSVLTGETGAGKSILLDSLGLVLGNRAETSLIRHGEEKLNVTASFAVQKNNPVWEYLKENEIEAEDELIIKRSLSSDGKGKIFINDQPTTLKMLKDISKFLVEVHGQFDNQGLLNPANHLSILDNYGGYKKSLEETDTAFFTYKKAKHARAEAESILHKAKEDEENLRHWVTELEKLKPQTGEEESLSQRRQELMNSEKIMESLNTAYQALNIQNAVRQAQSAVAKANHLVSGKYDALEQQLEQGLININEAISMIEEQSSNLNVDSSELNNLEERIYALKDVARKHHSTVESLPELLQEFRTKLNSIVLGEDGINKLRKVEAEAKLDYIAKANKLSDMRKKTAKDLDTKVEKELPPLKMEKAKFVTLINRKDETCWNEHGFDDVAFTVSTNPNSPQGPINKIASGGELARFMLALKVNLAQSSPVESLVFDEVDSGIGGATAQAVGERLARLAENTQVLVVTHSPQVASKSNNHFKVEKNTKNNITTTNVKELDSDQKAEEIARMLAGEKITDEARAAARVLINQ